MTIKCEYSDQLMCNQCEMSPCVRNPRHAEYYNLVMEILGSQRSFYDVYPSGCEFTPATIDNGHQPYNGYRPIILERSYEFDDNDENEQPPDDCYKKFRHIFTAKKEVPNKSPVKYKVMIIRKDKTEYLLIDDLNSEEEAKKWAESYNQPYRIDKY